MVHFYIHENESVERERVTAQRGPGKNWRKALAKLRGMEIKVQWKDPLENFWSLLGAEDPPGRPFLPFW